MQKYNTASRGRFSHCFTSSITASVTLEINVGDTSTSYMIAELEFEYQSAIARVHQLQLPNLSDRQKVDVLAELNASIIYLQSHCDDEL